MVVLWLVDAAGRDDWWAGQWTTTRHAGRTWDSRRGRPASAQHHATPFVYLARWACLFPTYQPSHGRQYHLTSWAPRRCANRHLPGVDMGTRTLTHCTTTLPGSPPASFSYHTYPLHFLYWHLCYLPTASPSFHRDSPYSPRGTRSDAFRQAPPHHSATRLHHIWTVMLTWSLLQHNQLARTGRTLSLPRDDWALMFAGMAL